ncbi:MAG: metallophosphoesterase [Rhodothermales bacterium]
MKIFSSFAFLLILFVLAGCTQPASNDKASQPPILSFGIVADAQYADKESSGTRYYRSSIASLDSAAMVFNGRDLGFVVHLGDIIDEDFSSYDDILPIYDKIEAPHYIVLGNHEFSVDESEKDRVVSRLGLTQRYYDFVVEGWRFIAVDGQGMSTFAPAEGVLSESENMLALLQEEGASNANDWNGGVDREQFLWLNERLELATQNGESVILFCHFPTYPLGMSHNLWNDKEIVELLASYPVVKAWFNGHNHDGYTGIRDGIHFITLKGMVNYPEENAYAIAHVYPDRIVVEGKGAVDTRIIPIRGVYGTGKIE